MSKVKSCMQIIVTLHFFYAGLSAATVQSPNAVSEGSSDIEWARWVVVSVGPARPWSSGWESDEKRQQLIDDFDPDALDFWSGMRMNRGDFFRMRGVASNAQMWKEYDAMICDMAGYGVDFFAENGMAYRETGMPANYLPTKYSGAYGANPMDEHWYHVVSQDLYRQTPYTDMLFQDNICNTLETNEMGFSNRCNEKFIEYMKNRFSPEQLLQMGMDDPDSFHIREYLFRIRQKTGILLGKPAPEGVDPEALIKEPVIHEYIRFSTMGQIDTWRKICLEAKSVAEKRGKAAPVMTGNQAGCWGTRPLATLQSQTSDVVWIESSWLGQPCFDGPRKALSSAIHKVGIASGGHRKPVRVVEYPAGMAYGEDLRLPTEIYGADAYANGTVPILAYTESIEKAKTETDIWKVNSDVARFAFMNRSLYIDREPLADVGLVQSLACSFWRRFSSLSIEVKHWDSFFAAARLLEDHHIPHEALIFGHPDVYDDTPALERLNRYKTVILPDVDCVSDRQVHALSAFVKSGGTLLLWGEVGTRDEELNVRGIPAFEHLADHPGKGQVVEINSQQVEHYRLPEKIIIPTSREGSAEWRYTFSEPAEDWQSENFDDSGWEVGKTPFEDSSGWEDRDLWLRKSITLDQVPFEAGIRFCQDGMARVGGWGRAYPGQGFEVYINGVPAGSKGFTYKTYYTMAINSRARAAFKPGRNVIAIHARQFKKDWRFLDLGLETYSNDEHLAEMIRPDNYLLKTNLPRMVWANVYRHGAGPMTSVQLVNYEVDLLSDTVVPAGPFTIQVRHDDPRRISQARFLSYNDRSEQIPFKVVDNKYIEVEISKMNLWGVIVLGAEDEIQARSAAAELRKWQQRLIIAGRTLPDASSNAHPLLQEAEQLLGRIQGHAKVHDFKPLIPALEEMTDRLHREVNHITTQVTDRQKTNRSKAFEIGGIYKFDFGNGGAPAGWIEITPESKYNKQQGYGWTVTRLIESVNQQLPDSLHGDFIRTQLPRDYYPGNKYWPSAHPAQLPSEFRVDLPDGDYIVTVITGSHEAPSHYADECMAGITYVDANDKQVLLGKPLQAGYWVYRTFPVQVSEDPLKLRFYGNNVGPYFHNAVDWLINGLIIQKADAQLTAPVAESLGKWKKSVKGQVRNWLLVGPFSDPDWRGLELTYPPERSDSYSETYFDHHVQLSWKSYTQGNDTVAGVPLYRLMDQEDGNGLARRGVVAFGAAHIRSEKTQDIMLTGSTSGRGVIYFNDKPVYEDNLAAGLIPGEFEIPVKLQAGWNKILVKSLHCWGGHWSFYISLLDREGNPVEGLTVSDTRPEDH